MTDPGFYDLEPGAIGTIQYKKNMMTHLSDEAKQQYVSRASNERMRAFMMNMAYGMNGNGPTDPTEAFIKARRDSWGDIEDGEIGIKVEAMSVQVGQKESYDAICKIENKDDFAGWLNPALVNMIKEQFKNSNNENNGTNNE
jgi:hypothetical protein